MSFDASVAALRCAHCGHSMDVPEHGGPRVVAEHGLGHGLASNHARGYGASVRALHCQECGAQVCFPDTLTAIQCDFCGSPQVLAQEQNRNLIRPESLIPFQVDARAARERFSSWLGGLWFRPSGLARQARVADMSGVYVPYWTFDARVRSDWRAEAGYHYYVTESVTERDAQGQTVTRTRQVRKTRWEPAAGARSDVFDDVLVCASRGLPPELATKLEPFDTGALEPYEPGYLAGWKAEEYAVDLDEGWQRAVSRMESSQDQRCRADIPGDTHRNFHAIHRFHDETFKHVLLPIWIASYRYRGELYRFLVNGQTGEVTGKAPLSFWKVALFVLLLAAIGAGIVLAVQSYQ